MRATKHTPRGPFRVLERRHGLAEIVERGANVLVESLRVSPPHLEHDLIAFSENASRQGHRFAQQRLEFFPAPKSIKTHRVAARHYEDALSVREAELSLLRRVGAPDDDLLVVQSNLANTHEALGRDEQTLSMLRDVYSGWVKLGGEEHLETLRAANNYATSLNRLERFVEAKPLFRKTMPVVRRVLGENDFRTLTMRGNYARALYLDDGATLDDLREAVTTLEDTNRIARRVLGNAHPTTNGNEAALRLAQAALRARETPSPSTPSESG
jgi:hypothetical protein